MIKIQINDQSCFIKNKYNDFEPFLKTTYENFKDKTLEYLNTENQKLSKLYLINNKIYTNSFKFSLNDNQLVVNVDSKQNEKEALKKKLKNNIANKRDNSRMSKKKIIMAEEKKCEKVTVPQEIQTLYKKASKKISSLQHIVESSIVPSPQLVLNNVESYKELFFRQLFKITLDSSMTQTKKTEILSHPYFNYMRVITGVTQEELQKRFDMLNNIFKNINNNDNHKCNESDCTSCPKQQENPPDVINDYNHNCNDEECQKCSSDTDNIKN